MDSPTFRVLLIAPAPRIVGGQAVQASRLMAEFARHGQVEVTLNPLFPKLPLRLDRIPVLRTLASVAIVWTRLLLLMPGKDIVHVFTAAYWGFLLWTTPAILLARLLGKPVIVNYRDGQCEDHLRNWPGAVATLALADRIVTSSGYLVTVMAKFGLTATVIPNMLDASRFIFRVREPMRTDSPVFLSSRLLEPLYNIPCIFRAFAQLQARFPGARLIMASEGPSRPALEALAVEMKLRNVEWRGKVPQSQMAALYDECDVYLNSPDLDNMPGSLLECLASGLPIVSTDAGGTSFVVENERSALLVPIGDCDALAASALRLWEEPGLVRRLAEYGLATCGRYKADAVVAGWMSLYRELVQTR